MESGKNKVSEKSIFNAFKEIGGILIEILLKALGEI
jgi:hypothetical protein